MKDGSELSFTQYDNAHVSQSVTAHLHHSVQLTNEWLLRQKGGQREREREQRLPSNCIKGLAWTNGGKKSRSNYKQLNIITKCGLTSV